MDTLNIVSLLKESKLSPEDLGELVGISGMTIRRWTEKPDAEPLPGLYQTAIRDAIFKLVIEGRLDSKAKSAQRVFSDPGSLPQQAAVKALGFPEGMSRNFADHQDMIMAGLSHIGSMESRRRKVDADKRKLPGYKRLGKEWGRRISVLTNVIQSKKLTSLDKFPAYGALFYLFMVFDLIPDTIPVFGLVDDFAILGIASAYYLKRHMKMSR